MVCMILKKKSKKKKEEEQVPLYRIILKYTYFGISTIIWMFFFLYGFITYYNENTYCVLTMKENLYFIGEQKTIYTGSLRDIEAELGLPRYNMGLYADYTGYETMIISRECKAIMPWKVIKNERETRRNEEQRNGEFGFPGQEGFGEILQS